MLPFWPLYCPPPSHPGIAVEATIPYPGISIYAPHWGATAAFIAQAHAGDERVIRVHGLHDDLPAQAALGYDEIVLDEPMHQGQTPAQVLDTLALARQFDAGATVGVVEPFAAAIDALLEAGARPDFVSGETYGGDVTLTELQRWHATYGVGTQMWATGTETVMAWENRVDLVIAADLNGSWGGPVYADALRARLSETCRTYLPFL